MDRELSKDKHPSAIRLSQLSGVSADFECKEDAEGYFEQRLSEESMNAFEVHILGCPVCTAKLEAMLAAKAEVGSLADQIRGLQDTGGFARFPWWKLTAAAACAAIVVAAISISIYSKKNSSSNAPSLAAHSVSEGPAQSSDSTIVASAEKPPAIDKSPVNGPSHKDLTPKGPRKTKESNSELGGARSKGITLEGADAVDNSVNGVRSTASQEAVQEFSPEKRPNQQPQGDTNETPTLTAAQGVELYRMAEVVPPPYTFSGLSSKSKLMGPRNDGQYSSGGAPSDTGRQIFQKAMAAYVEKHYGEAGDLLESAAQNEPKAADVHFYWGVCELLLGHPQDSIAPLKKAVALGNSPYLQSAHYYLAKAYLQEERFDEAAGELREAAALSGRLTSEAKSLLARTQALQAQLEKK